MTTPLPIDDESNVAPPPLDLSALVAETVPADTEPFTLPDFDKSKTPRVKRGPFNRSNDTDNMPPKRIRKITPRAKKGQFVEPLTQMYITLGMVAMPFDPNCATAVIQSAPECAKALDNLAYQNDAVRRALTSLTQTSAVGAVIAAHLPLIMAVTMHHVPKAKEMLGNFAPQTAENGETENV